MKAALFYAPHEPLRIEDVPTPGALDARTTRHPGYPVSRPLRKRVEEIFGRVKRIGLMRKTRHTGQATRWARRSRALTCPPRLGDVRHAV
jgi:hypothetical protein